MIDFEKEIEKVSDCLNTIREVCCMKFEFFVYPKYSIQGTKTIIQFNQYNKIEILLGYNLPKQAIRKRILENIICLMRGSLDNYENFFRS